MLSVLFAFVVVQHLVLGQDRGLVLGLVPSLTLCFFLGVFLRGQDLGVVPVLDLSLAFVLGWVVGLVGGPSW